jgi:hypothetical protein
VTHKTPRAATAALGRSAGNRRERLLDWLRWHRRTAGADGVTAIEVARQSGVYDSARYPVSAARADLDELAARGQVIPRAWGTRWHAVTSFARPHTILTREIGT